MLDINEEQHEILKHTLKNTWYNCEDNNKDMEDLCDQGLMLFVGRKSFVPGGYYKITQKGKDLLNEIMDNP